MADFGPWLPDLDPYGHDGLVTARNVYPSPLGYRPIGSPSAVTDDLPAAWRGGGAFRGLDGTTVLLAGTNSALYSYASGAWTSEHTGSWTGQWFMAQFGDIVICVNGGAPVKYTISAGTGGNLGGSPPNSSMVAIVRDFVFLAGDTGAVNTVTWSAINDAEGWTIGTNQCDEQILPDGGAVTGLAGGEAGLVFQESGITRFSYVGAPLIFRRDKVSEEVGSVAPGGVVQFGRNVFFLSHRGFYAYVDGGLQPIGKNRVDATFWATYTLADVKTYIRAAIDPNRSLAIWSMPDRLWIYNWDIERWSEVHVQGLVGVSVSINASVTLEGVDTLYPASGPGDIDQVPISLDDPLLQGGGSMLVFAMSDNILYSFGSATSLEATIRMARREMTPGRDTRIRCARVFGDMTGGITLGIGVQRRLGDAATMVEAQTMQASGRIPVRIAGRFMQPSVRIAAGTSWTYVRGLEFEYVSGGRR